MTEHYHKCDDYEQLDLSEADINILNALYTMSKEDGMEHGAAIVDGERICTFTSNLPNKVCIPEEIKDVRSLRLFHSHTIDSPLSPNDLSLLTIPSANEVCVITTNRKVYRVLINGGIKPNYAEYIESTEGLDDEVNFDIMALPDFEKWDFPTRNHMAKMEQMFRTVRLFKWRLEGGRI